MTDPSRLREADALLSDPRAFSPDPVRIEAPGWVEPLCWLAMVAIVVAFSILRWRI